MKLIAHIFIHNFFIAAHRVTEPLTAIIRKNRVVDISPSALSSGVRPGLPKRHALQACPALNCIDYQDHMYTGPTAALARECYNLSPRVEIPAANEAFIDLSGKKPPAFSVIRNFGQALVPRLGSFVTVSLAPSRLLAKAATMAQMQVAWGNKASVPGLLTKTGDTFRLCVVRPESAESFAARLPVELMWPLEDAVIKNLKSLGLHSFADLTGIPLTMMHRQFGSLSGLILDYSKGIDNTNIPVFHPPDKIIYHTSCEKADRLQLEELLKKAAVYIATSLQQRGQGYRKLELTLFYEDYGSATKTSVFTEAKYDIRSIYHQCINLLNKLRPEGYVAELYLAAGQLADNRYAQLALFADPKTMNSQVSDHKAKLAVVCKNLAAKYAPGVITMGKALSISRREQMLMFVDPFRSRGH